MEWAIYMHFLSRLNDCFQVFANIYLSLTPFLVFNATLRIRYCVIGICMLVWPWSLLKNVRISCFFRPWVMIKNYGWGLDLISYSWCKFKTIGSFGYLLFYSCTFWERPLQSLAILLFCMLCCCCCCIESLDNAYSSSLPAAANHWPEIGLHACLTVLCGSGGECRRGSLVW